MKAKLLMTNSTGRERKEGGEELTGYDRGEIKKCADHQTKKKRDVAPTAD